MDNNTIKRLIVEGGSNTFGISLIQHKFQLESLRGIDGDGRCLEIVLRALYWFDKPIEITVINMEFYKDGRVKQPGNLSFEMCNGECQKVSGWNDIMYPPPQLILKNVYREITDTINAKTDLPFTRGCNNLVAFYNVGSRGDSCWSEGKWKRVRESFINSIISLGYTTNVIEK